MQIFSLPTGYPEGTLPVDGKAAAPRLPLPWLSGEGRLGHLLKVARPDGHDSDDISWVYQKNHVSPHPISHELFSPVSLFGLNHWLSSFLMLRPLNPVSHVVVTLKHKTVSLPLHMCNLLLLRIVM